MAASFAVWQSKTIRTQPQKRAGLVASIDAGWKIIRSHEKGTRKQSMSGLSIKTYTILNGAEITSRQEVKKLLGKGDYEAYLNSSLRLLRNFGWKKWQELCVWSGLPCPNRPE
jgi:hypothetical protein